MAIYYLNKSSIKDYKKKIKSLNEIKFLDNIKHNKKYNMDRNMTEEDMNIIINIFKDIYNNIPNQEKENIDFKDDIKFNNKNTFIIAKLLNKLQDKTVRDINSKSRDIFDKKYNGVLYIVCKNKAIYGGKFVSWKH